MKAIQFKHAFRMCSALIMGIAMVACSGIANGSGIKLGSLPAPVEPLKNKIFVDPVTADSSASARCWPENVQEIQTEMLKRINALRTSGAMCGLKQYPATRVLKWNASLFQAALRHSNDMAQHNVVSHQSMDGRTLADRVLATGYRYSSLAENIAVGQKTVESAMTAWVNSAQHCEQMMDDTFEEIGVACIGKDNSYYRNYWTMDLGKPHKE